MMHVRALLICTALCISPINHGMNSQEQHSVVIDLTAAQNLSEQPSLPLCLCRPKSWMFRIVHYTAGLCAGTIACIPLFYSEVHDPKKIDQLVLNGAMAVSGVAGATFCAIELARIARDQCCTQQSLFNR